MDCSLVSLVTQGGVAVPLFRDGGIHVYILCCSTCVFLERYASQRENTTDAHVAAVSLLLLIS